MVDVCLFFFVYFMPRFALFFILSPSFCSHLLFLLLPFSFSLLPSSSCDRAKKGKSSLSVCPSISRGEKGKKKIPFWLLCQGLDFISPPSLCLTCTFLNSQTSEQGWIPPCCYYICMRVEVKRPFFSSFPSLIGLVIMYFSWETRGNKKKLSALCVSTGKEEVT